MSLISAGLGLASAVLGAKAGRDPRAWGKGKKGLQLAAAGGVIGGMPTSVPSAVPPVGITGDAMIHLAGVGNSILPGVGSVVPSVVNAVGSILGGTVGRTVATGAATVGTALGVGQAISTVFGSPKKRRRMNPLNVRAARRAIRRVKAVRKITNDIEKQLPHKIIRRSK